MWRLSQLDPQLLGFRYWELGPMAYGGCEAWGFGFDVWGQARFNPDKYIIHQLTAHRELDRSPSALEPELLKR